MKLLERLEMAQYRMEELLSLLHESSSTIRVSMERPDTKTVEMAMVGNVCLSSFMLPFYNIIYTIETV